MWTRRVLGYNNHSELQKAPQLIIYSGAVMPSLFVIMLYVCDRDVTSYPQPAWRRLMRTGHAISFPLLLPGAAAWFFEPFESNLLPRSLSPFQSVKRIRFDSFFCWSRSQWMNDRWADCVWSGVGVQCFGTRRHFPLIRGSAQLATSS